MLNRRLLYWKLKKKDFKQRNVIKSFVNEKRTAAGSLTNEKVRSEVVKKRDIFQQRHSLVNKPNIGLNQRSNALSLHPILRHSFSFPHTSTSTYIFCYVFYII